MIANTVSESVWITRGERLAETERTVWWDIGAWWCEGEELDRKALMGRDGWRGPSYSGAKAAGRVHRAFPEDRRRSLLTYAHHLEVLDLDRRLGDFLLEWCEEPIGEGGEPRSTRELRAKIKRLRRDAKTAELAEEVAAVPGRYGVIYADPPWRFEPYSRDSGMDRAADNHYPTMTLDAIKALEIPAADSCVLFMWATAPMLPQAFDVMAAWGFSYRSHCVWAKDRMGTGYWFRNSHELLLVGTRGAVPAPAPGQQYASVIMAPLGEHSAKPAAFAEMIEGLFPGVPALEMFARGPRLGWTVWGNEAPANVSAAEEAAA